MASAVPELTCGEYQSDMDSPKHGKGPEVDQEVQNSHPRGNGIYMDAGASSISLLNPNKTLPLHLMNIILYFFLPKGHYQLISPKTWKCKGLFKFNMEMDYEKASINAY